MKKRGLFIFPILFFIFFIIGNSFYSLSDKKKKRIPPTIQVKEGTITESIQAVGYIKPRHSITVKSQINGIVSKLYHFEGAFVKKGEPLVEIEPTPSPLEYASTHEELDQAIIHERSTLHDMRRYKKALKTGLITENHTDYIQAKKAYEMARSKRILATQKLSLLKEGKTVFHGKTIANCIKSPVTGYIINRSIEVGDPVLSLSSAQTSTILFTIANMGEMLFKGSVDEKGAAKIKIGMPAIVTIAALPHLKIIGKVERIALQSKKENQRLHQGYTSTLASESSPFNIGFSVEITQLQFPKGVLFRSGYSATAEIEVKTVEKGLILPMRAIHFKEDQPYVSLVTRVTKKTQESKEHPIKVGLSDGTHVEVVSGLEKGASILEDSEKEKSVSG